MKLLWSFVLVAVFASQCIDGKIKFRPHGPPPAGPAKSRAQPIMNTIIQPVDQFNVLDDRTWSMRYLSNDEFFKAGGPIYIFLGGEWEISTGYLLTGQMFDLAKQTNGYMYYTEHRYYGKSYPLPNFTTESLQYLNVDQALADVAYFITDRKKNVPGLENSKVVVVGGSYSASMATWIRQKYPHLVDAALASSAPLVATEDYFRYYEVVGHNIIINSLDCYNVIEEAIEEMETAIKTPTGIEQVSKLFNTCETVRTTEPHRAFFFNAVSEIFAGLIQYAQVGQIKRECDALLRKEGTSMEKLGAYIQESYGGACIGGYDEFVEEYSNTEASLDIFRQWFYQCCTEYAYWQTTNSIFQPFGKTVFIDLFHEICKDIYGPEYTPELTRKGIERTNIQYGGIKPDVTKVFSVHGTVDPWHALGVLEDINSLAPSVLVNGTSHCQDLNSISSNDLPEMKAAKERVQKTILDWIK